jgi:hypothetical protein
LHAFGERDREAAFVVDQDVGAPLFGRCVIAVIEYLEPPIASSCIV